VFIALVDFVVINYFVLTEIETRECFLIFSTDAIFSINGELVYCDRLVLLFEVIVLHNFQSENFYV